MKRVFIVAGESSGDLHGSSLMRSMKARCPDVAFKGVGGMFMERCGLEIVRHVREMNFMGMAEIIRHIPFIRRVMRECESCLDSWNPDLVILIDYPGFNLKFAPLVKKRGVPLMYYISPQLWAWHKSRVAVIRRYVDRMVVLFEFEKDFYRRYGVAADFVGHPLLDVVKPSGTKEAFRESVGAGEGLLVVGLLPGSRVQEITRVLPDMVRGVGLLKERLGSFAAVLGCAPEIEDSIYERYIGGTGIVPVRGGTYDVMAYSDALAVTSGTATLEAGILGTPMVIVYRTSLLTYLMGRALVGVPDIGLINIVAGGRIVPELRQNDVTPYNIAALLEKLMGDADLRDAVKRRLGEAKSRLGRPGASERAAGIACELMGA